MANISAENDGPVDSPGNWKIQDRHYHPPHSRAIPVPKTQHKKQNRRFPPVADFPTKLPAKTLNPCSSSDEEASASEHTSKDQSLANFQLESRSRSSSTHANRRVSCYSCCDISSSDVLFLSCARAYLMHRHQGSDLRAPGKNYQISQKLWEAKHLT